jgi:hypothetical protein
LSVHKLHKTDLQPLADAVADRLPPWKARLMSRAGRVTLTNTTLSSIPVHVSIAVTVSTWILKVIDKLRRAFKWTGSEAANGGQCLVAWSRVTRPVELGGFLSTGAALQPDQGRRLAVGRHRFQRRVSRLPLVGAGDPLFGSSGSPLSLSS